MNKILNQHFNAFKQAAAQGDYVKAYQHVKKSSKSGSRTSRSIV